MGVLLWKVKIVDTVVLSIGRVTLKALAQSLLLSASLKKLIKLCKMGLVFGGELVSLANVVNLYLNTGLWILQPSHHPFLFSSTSASLWRQYSQAI